MSLVSCSTWQMLFPEHLWHQLRAAAHHGKMKRSYWLRLSLQFCQLGKIAYKSTVMHKLPRCCLFSYSQLLQKWVANRQKGLSAEIAPYWNAGGELTICGNLLLNGNCIVVPKSLLKRMLTKIHNGHLGIQRCHLRAKAAITHQLDNFVKQCPKCVN